MLSFVAITMVIVDADILGWPIRYADILDKYNTTVSIVSIANDTTTGYSWYARRRKAGPFSTWKPTALIGCHADVNSTHCISPARLYQDALQLHVSLPLHTLAQVRHAVAIASRWYFSQKCFIEELGF